MKKDKVGLKEIIANEKAQMLPIVFTVSYVITPIYLIITFSLLVVTLLVNPTTLKIIESLDIKPDGMDVLEYIISDKKEAFEQIYNKGYVVIR
ncbi:MAG: hypothetical protein J6K64_01450 [Clostridia bacterium]|nr:hypothetical protein [Clostridia bacterium]